LSETKQKTPSKTQQDEQTDNTGDIFSVYKESVDKYFSEMKATTADYLQSITNLQEELIESRKKNIDSAIAIQKTFATNLGFNFEPPAQAVQMINNLSEQIQKGVELENKMLMTSINTLEKNIGSYNENAKTFSDMNTKILDSWASALKSVTKK